MLEGRSGALLAKALLHMQQGQLPVRYPRIPVSERPGPSARAQGAELTTAAVDLPPGLTSVCVCVCVCVARVSLWPSPQLRRSSWLPPFLTPASRAGGTTSSAFCSRTAGVSASAHRRTCDRAQTCCPEHAPAGRICQQATLWPQWSASVQPPRFQRQALPALSTPRSSFCSS